MLQSYFPDSSNNVLVHILQWRRGWDKFECGRAFTVATPVCDLRIESMDQGQTNTTLCTTKRVRGDSDIFSFMEVISDIDLVAGITNLLGEYP